MNPVCKCGCGTAVTWDSKHARWHAYYPGHYRKQSPYKSEEWLRHEYETSRKTTEEIAHECGVSSATIIKFMNKFGIARRSKSEARIGRRSGSRNPSWRGGVTPERQRLYRSREWRDLLTRCFERDRFLCTRCGAPKRGKGSLHAHHLMSWSDHPDLRMDIDNVVTLCRPCHAWVHSRANVMRDFIFG